MANMKFVSIFPRGFTGILCRNDFLPYFRSPEIKFLGRTRDFSTDSDAMIESEATEGTQMTGHRKKREVQCPENAKLMKVSIIGVPNAGKSTIINALTNYEVCPVSSRPHTTRRNQKAVYLDENTQLVFVDTPGLVSVKEIKKFSFKEEFVFGPEKSIGTAHLIAVIHDVSHAQSRDKLDFRIKSILEKFPDKKSILIMNKIDTIKTKRDLLQTMTYLTSGVVGGNALPLKTFQEKKQSHQRLNTESILSNAKARYAQQQQIHRTTLNEELENSSKYFTPDEIKKGIHTDGWPRFHDVFMVSGLNGDGIDLLRKYITVNAVPEQWLYDSETLTDVAPAKLALRILRAKLLEHLPQEIPFRVIPLLEHWDDTESATVCVRIKIRCPKERYKWRIIGSGGSLINRITEDTARTLSRLLHRPVNLTIDPVFDKQLANMPEP